MKCPLCAGSSCSVSSLRPSRLQPSSANSGEFQSTTDTTTATTNPTRFLLPPTPLPVAAVTASPHFDSVPAPPSTAPSLERAAIVCLFFDNDASFSLTLTMFFPPCYLPPMSIFIAIANQKDGVAKTTTCLNLGHALSEGGRRVLLCDLDPQSSFTISLGFDVRELPPPSTTSCSLQRQASASRTSFSRRA